MGTYLKRVLLSLRQTSRISHLKNTLFACSYSDILYSFPTVKIHIGYVLIVSKQMLHYLDICVLSRNWERLQRFDLFFHRFSSLTFKDIIICGKWKYVFIAESENHSLYTIIFLCG